MIELQQHYDNEVLSLLVSHEIFGKFSCVVSRSLEEKKLAEYHFKNMNGTPKIILNDALLYDRELLNETLIHELMHLVFDLKGHTKNEVFPQEYVVSLLTPYIVSIVFLSKAITKRIMSEVNNERQRSMNEVSDKCH